MKTNSHNTSILLVTALALTAACVVLSSLCLYALHCTRNEMHTECAALETGLGTLGGRLENLSSSTQTNFLEQNKMLSQSFERETSAYGRLDRQIGTKINTLNQTYSGLLQEQQKQRVSTTEKDTEITAAQTDGEHLFAQGRYREAAEKFNSVLVYQKTNQTVRFYAAYAEFLSNPMDSTQYGKIVRVFNGLKQEGFQRNEIDTTLEYIKNETGK